ncbi:hypothetical protein ICM05_04460 [Leucobacter sp. cx-42]|uniref:hypothetical protein n=1 Tax=unclassified Leucobacter TaxID=2621730 RepID=UPI00165D4D9A|nr:MULTISPECIES: hypothetical protein [unclassified Leucobacter]MBC9953898.1 hypothetical protein [Leucobacter sp. cx-42]
MASVDGPNQDKLRIGRALMKRVITTIGYFVVGVMLGGAILTVICIGGSLIAIADIPGTTNELHVPGILRGVGDGAHGTREQPFFSFEPNFIGMGVFIVVVAGLYTLCQLRRNEPHLPTDRPLNLTDAAHSELPGEDESSTAKRARSHEKGSYSRE